MAKPLVDDELWEVVEPLLPRRPARPKVGKPPADDRVCLTGILFVLKTGIAWEDFRCEMGCCGMTLLNRLRQWPRQRPVEPSLFRSYRTAVRQVYRVNGTVVQYIDEIILI